MTVPLSITSELNPDTAPTAPRIASSGLLAPRRVTAVLLVIGPLAEIVEAALSPLTNTTTAADLAAITAHQQAFVVSVVIGVIGTLFYIPAFLGLLEICRARSPRWARLSAWLMITSIGCFLGVRGAQGVELSLARSGLPNAQAATILDGGFQTPMGMIIFVCFLGGAFLGLIAIAITCWRAGLPRPAAVLIGLFQIVDLLAPTHWGTVFSHTVLLVGLGWVGVALWQGTARAPKVKRS